jgi:hypothetical protein
MAVILSRNCQFFKKIFSEHFFRNDVCIALVPDKTRLRTFFSAPPVLTRVARWFVFKSKIPILVRFGGSWIRKCCYILWPFGIFMAIWYNLQPFGLVCGHLCIVLFPFWYVGTKKNLAALDFWPDVATTSGSFISVAETRNKFRNRLFRLLNK